MRQLRVDFGADAFERRTGNMARVARGSEIKAHYPSGFYDEDEDLRRKIHEFTDTFTVSAKTSRDGYQLISRRQSLPIFLLVNGKWSMVNSNASSPGEFCCD